MRKRAFSIIFLLIISSVIMTIYPILFSVAINSGESHGKIGTLNTSASTEINTTVIIDDLPGSLTNWTWAKDQGYCTGLGTQSDPYVISDIFFNTSTVNWNCLTIKHSRKHFIVRDCEFKGAALYGGIQLHNTTNGVITENMMYPLTGALVWVFNASYNVIQNNNASAGFFFGFLIDSNIGITKMNVISDNLITHNLEAGIELRGGSAVLNTISDNYIFNNPIGINLEAFTYNTTITGNHIGNSSSIGISIDAMSQNHEIFENCFFTNSLHAGDNGGNNIWDNGTRGNYWDNYIGLDGDSDGIGDIPYNITGASGSQDNFPLMSCPTPPTPPTPTPSGIPGYDTILVIFAGVASIIGIIFIITKKKIKF